MYLSMTRCLRTTRFLFFCGLKTFSGEGIIAERNAAYCGLRLEADLLKYVRDAASAP